MAGGWLDGSIAKRGQVHFGTWRFDEAPASFGLGLFGLRGCLARQRIGEGTFGWAHKKTPCDSQGVWVDHQSSTGDLLARADSTGQTAVIDAVGVVPERLAQLDAAAQNFDLVGAASWSVSGFEFVVLVRDKIFVVAVAQDCFKDVLALTHKIRFPETIGRDKLIQLTVLTKRL